MSNVLLAGKRCPKTIVGVSAAEARFRSRLRNRDGSEPAHDGSEPARCCDRDGSEPAHDGSGPSRFWAVGLGQAVFGSIQLLANVRNENCKCLEVLGTE